MERILVLNPGSTSTKLAVYLGETPLFTNPSPTVRRSWLPSSMCMSSTISGGSW